MAGTIVEAPAVANPDALNAARADSAPRIADFFVVGGPRCGTTSLCRYLSKHPAICFSRPKETHYFARLPADWTPERLGRDYLDRYFPHRQAGHRLLGEGSVSYLYAPEVLERILRLNPEARMIALVRNPLDMLPSYHLRMLYILAEDVEDFSEAWKLQEARMRGERVPQTCPDARLLCYRDIASFGAQVERLYRVAGRERSMVLVFDDFASDPLGVYRRVLDFLGVEYDGRTDFSAKLPSRRYRYRFIQRLLWSPPKAVRGVLEDALLRAKQKKRPGKRSLLKRLARWNSVDANPAPLPPELRAELRSVLADDVARLGDLLGRDLSHWLA
jgi:hypothetical protein